MPLIGLDGFEALEQEQPDLEVYRDSASLLVSENFGLDGYRAKNRSHAKPRSWGRAALALAYVPRVVQDQRSESLRD